ncbi:MAG: serine/threonine protein kinase [Planctomycetaceae bacterium]|nr:serine/threonine protein kinase [Planctomycetaceae bacterium]
MNAIFKCLTEEELIALLSGESLSSEKTTHIQHCQQCRETREQIRSDLDAIRAVANSSIEGLAFSNPDVRRPSRPPLAGTSFTRDLNGGRLTNGSTVGNYTVIRLLGRGGQAEAYLVRQTDKGEDSPRFVLKITRVTDAYGIPLSTTQQQQLHIALRAEEETLYKLRGIAGTLQYVTAGHVELEPGTAEPYLVTDYVHGQTLYQRAGEFAKPQQAIALVAAITDILSRVHRLGIIHGDLKPQNIMLRDDDSPTIIDFGLARIRDVWNQGEDGERQGGTVQYMAPEQAVGDQTQIGPATDVFALGAILQQLITRQRLYRGDDWKACLSAAKAGQIQIANAPTLGHYQLQKVVAKCLSIAPQDRYANARDLAAALARISFSGQKRWLGLIALPLLIAAVGLVSWYSYFRPIADIPEQQPETEIAGLLGSNDIGVGEWNKKLPVTVGHSLRIDAIGPAKSKWFLVWVYGEKLRSIYSVESSEDPLLVEPTTNGVQDRIIWPSAEDCKKITGDGGTEMLFLVGFPSGHAMTEARLTELVDAALLPAESWPPLPDTVLIRFDSQQVDSRGPSGKLRGPGENQAVEFRQVEATIKRIQESLRKESIFLRGEAFCVGVLD